MMSRNGYLAFARHFCVVLFFPAFFIAHSYADPTVPINEVQTFDPLIVGVGVLILIIMTILFFRHTTLLRDPLLPQLKPTKQTYSLARCQMAFWFVLIASSYVFIYLLVGDMNTITDQSLWLMGISGVTGGGAVFVDAIKDTPVDRANAYLRTLGLMSYDDVERLFSEQTVMDGELSDLERRRSASSDENEVGSLTAMINALNSKKHDRAMLLQSYRRIEARFQSKNFISDITTDINGSALHRLQLVVWTIILGGIFARQVLMNHAMPEFSPQLLMLLGISGTGYFGFKYSEVQK